MIMSEDKVQPPVRMWKKPAYYKPSRPPRGGRKSWKPKNRRQRRGWRREAIEREFIDLVKEKVPDKNFRALIKEAKKRAGVD